MEGGRKEEKKEGKKRKHILLLGVVEVTLTHCIASCEVLLSSALTLHHCLITALSPWWSPSPCLSVGPSPAVFIDENCLLCLAPGLRKLNSIPSVAKKQAKKKKSTKIIMSLLDILIHF
jgi:hypothetical protein